MKQRCAPQALPLNEEPTVPFTQQETTGVAAVVMQCSQRYLGDRVKLGKLVAVVRVGKAFFTRQLRESKHGMNHACFQR